MHVSVFRPGFRPAVAAPRTMLAQAWKVGSSGWALVSSVNVGLAE
jgi:hypothetical protein